MKNKTISKLTRFYRLALIGVLFYPIRLFAQAQTKYGPVPPIQELYGVQAPMYGIEPVPMPVLYGPSPMYATWTLEKFLLIIVLPLGILLAIAIGLLVYLKKREKKNVKKNH